MNSDNVIYHTSIIAIAAGEKHSVFLHSDHTVTATGDNSNGQCDVGEWKNVKRIVAQDDMTIAITQDGAVLSTSPFQYVQSVSSTWTSIVDVCVCGIFELIAVDADGFVHSTLFSQNYSFLNDWTNVLCIASNRYGAVYAVQENGAVLTGGKSISQIVTQWNDMIYIYADIQQIIGINNNGDILTSRAVTQKAEIGQVNMFSGDYRNSCHFATLNPMWNTIKKLSQRVTYWRSDCYFLLPNGTIWSRKTARIIDGEGFDLFSWSNVVAIASDKDSEFLAGIRDDGTVIVAGYAIESSWRSIIPKVCKWESINSIAVIDNCLFGLRSDGKVLVACLDDNANSHLKSWKNISQILVTCHWNRKELIALTSDGHIKTTDKKRQKMVEKWSDVAFISSVDSEIIAWDHDGHMRWTDGELFSASPFQRGFYDPSNLLYITGDYKSGLGIKKDGSLFLFPDASNYSHWGNMACVFYFNSNITVGISENGQVLFGEKSMIHIEEEHCKHMLLIRMFDHLKSGNIIWGHVDSKPGFHSSTNSDLIEELEKDEADRIEKDKKQRIEEDRKRKEQLLKKEQKPSGTRQTEYPRPTNTSHAKTTKRKGFFATLFESIIDNIESPYETVTLDAEERWENLIWNQTNSTNEERKERGELTDTEYALKRMERKEHLNKLRDNDCD